MPAQAAGPRDRRRRPRAERALVSAARSDRGPPQRARRRVPGRPRPPADRRSRRCSWPSRPPWRPARPSTSRASWPSSARPGAPRRSRSSARRDAVDGRCSHAALAPDRRSVARSRPDRSVGRPRPPTGSSATMEGDRATWQYWHVYAEAQRQVRAADLPTDQVDQRWSSCSSTRSWTAARSPSTRRPRRDRRTGRAAARSTARRSTLMAGADLFTSATVLAAEQRLVAAAGRPTGAAVDRSRVELALLEIGRERRHPQRRPGHPGRARWPPPAPGCSWRSRPPGPARPPRCARSPRPGPTAAGSVVGLAPSAAAAASSVLDAPSIGIQTDTLAKLTHALAAPATLPDWVAAHRPAHAGGDRRGRHGRHPVPGHRRAATSSSAAAASGWSVTTSSSPRSAPAACCATSDATHGALHAERARPVHRPRRRRRLAGAARGRPEALGFYLDHDRVHVGDLATMTEDVFAAWAADRAAGLDSIMLAPTRDLVSELNQRARAHRLDGTAAPPRSARGRAWPTATRPRVGDLIITRANDRRLRSSATDWVKNGDRWTVLAVHDGGDLTVQHTAARPHRPPARRVRRAPRPSSATPCTVHTAQGVTADTMHGLATGTESRQQLYTMLTRGRHANHVYLEVVGDGDPHTRDPPDPGPAASPPTDILEPMLARDDAQRSATSLAARAADPAARLGEAAQRYLDSLYVAAEQAVGPQWGVSLSPDSGRMGE